MHYRWVRNDTKLFSFIGSLISHATMYAIGQSLLPIIQPFSTRVWLIDKFYGAWKRWTKRDDRWSVTAALAEHWVMTRLSIRCVFHVLPRHVLILVHDCYSVLKFVASISTCEYRSDVLLFAQLTDPTRTTHWRGDGGLRRPATSQPIGCPKNIWQVPSATKEYEKMLKTFNNFRAIVRHPTIFPSVCQGKNIAWTTARRNCQNVGNFSILRTLTSQLHYLI